MIAEKAVITEADIRSTINLLWENYRQVIEAKELDKKQIEDYLRSELDQVNKLLSAPHIVRDIYEFWEESEFMERIRFNNPLFLKYRDAILELNGIQENGWEKH